MHAGEIAKGTPAWVYVLFVALVVLGVRRLRTREMPLAVGLIPSAAFLIWSIVGVHAFAVSAGYAIALSAWLSGAAVGATTAVALPDPRGELLPSRRVRQPGSLIPLFLYLGVFSARFACGAVAAVVPAQATTATAIGIAVSAGATARIFVGILRWTSVPVSPWAM